MNTKLIDSLFQVIQCLPKEERQLLEKKLFFESSDPTIKEIIKLAENSPSFDFLNDEPDIYSLEDGEPI
jgi:hypothetical protein